MRDCTARRSRKRGVILLTASGIIFVLLAFIGLAFDVGYLQWQRRRAQAAADGAAMAAAWAKQTGAAIVDKGRQGSAMNGFTHGTGGIAVTINNPPTQGAYTGNDKYVEAIVTQDAPSFFLQVLNWSTLPVRARAVTTIQAFDQSCIFALNQTAKNSLSFSGGAAVNLGCGAVNESNNGSATSLSGNTTVTVTNGATIASVGGHVINGGSNAPAEATFADNVNSPGDPLASLPMPDPTKAPYTGMARYDSATVSSVNSSGGTLYPGVYCGGIQLNSGSTVTFNPGMYILASGGLDLNSTTVNGAGVTFYTTDDKGDPWNCPGLTGNKEAGPIQIHATANVTFSAPLDNTYVESAYIGMLMFQNRADSYNQNNIINGSASSVFDGAFYFPTTALNFAGTSDANGYLMLIGDTVNFTGGTALALNNFPTGLAGGNIPLFKKWVTLAE